MLSLVLSLVMGFQSQTRNHFLKALFHAYVSAVCGVVASSFIMPFFWGWKISEVAFCMSIALCGLGLGCSMGFSLLVGLFWVVFLLLLGLALWTMRKNKNRTFRIVGQMLTILVFAAILTLAHYRTVRAIGEGMAVAALIMSAQ